MSTDYSLVCHKHRERVDLCSIGFSGPLLQCDKSLAAFSIQHEVCSLNVVDEQDDSVEDYKKWTKDRIEEYLDFRFVD